MAKNNGKNLFFLDSISPEKPIAEYISKYLAFPSIDQFIFCFFFV